MSHLLSYGICSKKWAARTLAACCLMLMWWGEAECQPPSTQHKVFLVHGLNNTARVMLPLRDVISLAGYQTSLVHLHGHEDSTENDLPENIWVDDIAKSLLSDNSNEKSVIAYSLGGLSTLLALEQHPDIRLSRLILLAPALSLRSWTKLLYLSYPASILPFNLPAMTPLHYRSRQAVPSEWYKELLRMRNLQDTIGAFIREKNIPTLIFISPDDEFIDVNELEEWIKENNLNSWRIIKVNPKSAGDTLPSHLILDERSMGKVEWERMSAEIVEFLNQ